MCGRDRKRETNVNERDKKSKKSCTMICYNPDGFNVNEI